MTRFDSYYGDYTNDPPELDAVDLRMLDEQRTIADDRAELDRNGAKDSQVTTNQQLGCFPLDSETYHADKSAWSKTMIQDFRERRSVCHARHILGTAPEERVNKKMDLGQLAHAALLEPHKLETDYVAFPHGMLDSRGACSSNEAKKWRDERQAEGKIVMKIEDFVDVAAMVKSIKAKIGDLITPDAKIEHAIYWRDTETSIMCRCRPDLLIVRQDRITCIDIKTTADVSPEAFQRRIEDNGYLLQDSHYSEGIYQAFGIEPRFLFIPVETAWPFTSAIYEIDEADRDAGRTMRRDTMTEIWQCLDTGNWADVWEQKVNKVRLRARALR